MNINSASTYIHFAPLIEGWTLYAVITLGLIIFTISMLAYRRGAFVRGIVFALFILFLFNPSLIQEQREYVKDVGAIVVDQSLSQSLDKRDLRTQSVLRHLENRLNNDDVIEYRIIQAPNKSANTKKTELFTSLDQALADIPQQRRAGVVLLSDGQIHDVPDVERLAQSYGPVHLMISGRKNEKDRRITVVNAPAYGLIGKDVRITFKVEDTANIRKTHALVTLTMHNGETLSDYVEIGKEHSFNVTLDHPSENIFTLDVDQIDEELTYANNKTAVIINGVRDRLKVLLVSGIPHTGERTWRDLLTSDPGVDLVHFTILREPDKFDYTPKNEMSLIAFPFRELFEVKLYDFDLIIFDRYRVNNILPRRYFENIARYVREGGAFLEASGPAFAGDQSIYDTPLGDILPARPTGNITQKGFVPIVNNTGAAHPVTQSLIWNKKEDSKASIWGKWLRYINIEPLRGDVLMHAFDSNPLLVLDRVGKGRVAQLSSDHIWLWSRGYDGGGPHAELLRRIVHWLMKEPELDERAMDIQVYGNQIIARKRAANGTKSETISLTLPNGDIQTVEMTPTKSGTIEYKHTAQDIGIYAFEDVHGTRRLAMVGDFTSEELNDVVATSEKLSDIVEATGGSIIWLEEEAQPVIRYSDQARRYGGSDWIAFKRNRDYTTVGTRNLPLTPDWGFLVILLSSLIYAWWREGRSH